MASQTRRRAEILNSRTVPNASLCTQVRLPCACCLSRLAQPIWLNKVGNCACHGGRTCARTDWSLCKSGFLTCPAAAKLAIGRAGAKRNAVCRHRSWGRVITGLPVPCLERTSLHLPVLVEADSTPAVRFALPQPKGGHAPETCDMSSRWPFSNRKSKNRQHDPLASVLRRPCAQPL